MEDLEAELELATEELAFWREFAKWFGSKYGNSEGPRTIRLLQILETAQRRCIDAEISTQKYVTVSQFH